MSDNAPTIEQYNTSLLPALIAYMEGNAGLMTEHAERFGVPLHPNPKIQRMSILKAVTGHRDVPMHLRSKAKAELKAVGFASWDDGDVP